MQLGVIGELNKFSLILLLKNMHFFVELMQKNTLFCTFPTQKKLKKILN